MDTAVVLFAGSVGGGQIFGQQLVERGQLRVIGSQRVQTIEVTLRFGRVTRGKRARDRSSPRRPDCRRTDPSAAGFAPARSGLSSVGVLLSAPGVKGSSYGKRRHCT